MQSKKQKFIYWLLGLGSGMIVSGLLMTVIGLRVVDQTNQTANPMSQLAENQQELAHKDTPTQENIPMQEEEIPAQKGSSEEESNQGEGTQKEDNEEAVVKEEQQEARIESQPDMTQEILVDEVLQEQNNQEDPSLQVADESAQIKRNVYIPVAATATSIARQLAGEGIIEDSDAFVNYIRQKEKLNLLRSGSFWFPETATYEEALNILLRK